MIQCKSCDFKSKTIHGLAVHTTKIHNFRILEEKVQCLICKKVLQRCYLREHQDRLHGKPNIKCTECDFITTHERNLIFHMQLLHTKNAKRYECDICGHKATQASHLNLHINSVHLGLKFTCIICKKEYTQKSHLNTHVTRFHKKEKRFECNVCGEKSQSKQALNMHMSAIHMKIKFPCSQCPKQLTTQSSLNAHIRNVHSVQDHCCSICPYQTKNPKVLKDHIQFYHLKKPKYGLQKCKICNYKGYLLKEDHMSIHQEEYSVMIAT